MYEKVLDFFGCSFQYIHKRILVSFFKYVNHDCCGPPRTKLHRGQCDVLQIVKQDFCQTFLYTCKYGYDHFHISV